MPNRRHQGGFVRPRQHTLLGARKEFPGFASSIWWLSTQTNQLSMVDARACILSSSSYTLDGNSVNG